MTATKKKFVYRFTGEHGPEDFPTLGRTFTKKGETHESAEPIEHPRLKLVSSESAKKKAKPKKEAPKSEPPAEPEEAKE